MIVFDNKAVVITGGTGSLGKVLTRRHLAGEISEDGEFLK